MLLLHTSAPGERPKSGSHMLTESWCALIITTSLPRLGLVPLNRAIMENWSHYEAYHVRYTEMGSTGCSAYYLLVMEWLHSNTIICRFGDFFDSTQQPGTWTCTPWWLVIAIVERSKGFQVFFHVSSIQVINESLHFLMIRCFGRHL